MLVLIFCANVSETIFILRKIQGNIITNLHMLYVYYPLDLLNFNET